MNHGEVWTVSDPTDPARRWHTAVVSGDAYNGMPGAAPFCVPLARRPAGGVLPPFVVELADPDPVGGVALVGELLQIPARYGVEPIGMLTGASVARLGAALRDLFEL